MKTLQVRMGDEEYAALVEQAGGTGKKLSSYCRARLLSKDDLEPEAPVSPAVKATQRQIERIAEHETARKRMGSPVVGGFVPCAGCTNTRCGRLHVPLCDPCLAAHAKASESAAETFSHLDD